MNYLQPVNRNQLTLMNSLDDLISENNNVRIIDLVVEKIVLSNPEKFIRQRETEVGRPAYSPQTLLKLYLYGYLNGISSSRKLETETYRNIEIMWLLGKLKPDHWTISNYRKEQGDEIKLVTREFRRFLKEKGYIKGETVAIDGTKVKANANRDMLTEKKIENKLKNLNEQIENYLEKMAGNDIAEDIEEEMSAEKIKGSEINKALINKIIEAQKKIEKLEKEKEYLEKSGKKRVSPNDKEARLMKTRDGKLAAYNVQFVIDQENKLIADSEVVTEENDIGQLESMVESVEDEIGKRPKEVITDKGYYNPNLIEKVQSTGETECYVDVKNKKEEEIEFTYDKEKDEYECSEGKRLVLISKGKKRRSRLADVYQGIECDGCKMRDKCTKAKKGRIIHRYYDHQWLENYKKKMEGKVAREKIKKRKAIIEHTFGTIKCWMGKIPLLLSGKEKVATEINIYTTAYNLKRLMNIIEFEQFIDEIKGYNWAIA